MTLAAGALVGLSAACGSPTALPEGPATTAAATTSPPGSRPTTTAEPPTTTTTEARPPPFAPPSPVIAPTGDRRVFVLGDSVILGAGNEVRGALAGWEVTVDAQESRLINNGIAVLAARRTDADSRAAESHEQAVALAMLAGMEPPPPPPPSTYADVVGPVVVVSLCTNYASGGGFASYVDALMAELSSVPRVVWVTCGEWSAGQIEANAAIRAAPARHSRAVVADWAPHGAWPAYTYDDGIHLTGEGRAAMAEVVARAVGPPPGFG